MPFLGPFSQLPSIVNIDFLLPNGLILNLDFKKESVLEEIRHKVLEEASKFASIDSSLSLKHKPNDYIFTSISQEAVKHEFYDYSKRLCDLKLFFTFFQLVEANGNLEEKLYNSDLSKAIGLYVNELDKINDEELVDYRIGLLKEIKSNFENNLNNHESLIKCIYSPNLEIDPNLLDFNQINSKLDRIELNDKKINICIFVNETGLEETSYSLSVPLCLTPSDLIAHIITLKMENLNHRKEQIEKIVESYKDSYVLNVCGCDEVLYGSENKICSYKYIRKCISDKSTPNFYLVSIEKLKSRVLKKNNYFMHLVEKYLDTKINLNKAVIHENYQSLCWDLNENFNIYLENLIYVPYVKECEKLYFKIAIYHGQEMKYEIESDTFEYEKISGKDSSLRLNKYIPFDHQIRKLHRCDKICISLYCVSKRKREFFSIGWISLNLFDYKGELISGKKKLYLWQANQDSFANQCLSSVTGQNTEKDYVRLNCEFLRNKPPENKISYPNTEQIKNFIKKTFHSTFDECIDVKYALENDNGLLKTILSKDALAELSEQEKNVLWRRKEDCINYPHSLSKLLQSINWSNKSDVLEIYSLLFKWPLLRPVHALELLNKVHADIEIRNFACKCLDKYMKDEELNHYLLQLVQTLKDEPYCDNALSRFLLKRALNSQKIGFDLFWNLRSEIKNPKYKFRFGLLLEAYCRSLNSNQLSELIKQIEVVEKLTNLALEIKSNPDNLSLIKSSYLNDTLQRLEYKLTLSNFISHLNRFHYIGLIEPDKCKILTSAKRPLYLTWKNGSEYSKYYETYFELIFKHGDDLRQDMLTIQILKLMNILWESEGLDLKMITYDCYSTGSKTGFIEVIKNSLTLFKIQMQGGMKSTYQIDTLQLYRWIYNHNDSKENLEKATENFTKSCAAFCVATFILGIGDRHPDNIMVRHDGQLFHIDFGHFLGHFKKKYGIKRERVPFVLTEDFTRVISKGSMNPIETQEFEEFRYLCEKAYMVIRRHSNLIINLFIMMLSSDMPELQSIEDILYLRRTLAIDESDEKALEYFRNQFYEAYRLSFTTKIDWMCHALNKKNLI
ncbi:unnamed protein product [Brachionus calyciflorus]|uniref:Phosphatidylinositol 3-kinase n=1 Tax=Brachionus calyciflorus TaxID=104777 RepID=A0A813NF83_9BILA|nr:unnamed protein product [Brachionus calyciflorus]